MQSTKLLRYALPLVAVVIAASCGDSPEADADRRELDDATRERVAAVGDSAATALMGTLGGRLHASLAAGGPAGAIDFCAGEAQALTDSVGVALGPGWAVKRTTDRPRNPVNAPDTLEAEALAFFRAGEAAGERPDGYVQRAPAGDYRYYRPLRMGAPCLQCHGDPARMDPAVRQVLQQRYPADAATGYAEGDFRGVVRVTVPRTAIEG